MGQRDRERGERDRNKEMDREGGERDRDTEMPYRGGGGEGNRGEKEDNKLKLINVSEIAAIWLSKVHFTVSFQMNEDSECRTD